MGLLNVKELGILTTMNLTKTTDSLNITLANSLIHYQSTGYHPEAKAIFEGVLERNPISTSCLLGIGLISKVDKDFPEAVDFLQRALERDTSNILIRGELSWCRALTGDLKTGLNGLRDALERLQEERFPNQDFKGELLYRIGYCGLEIRSGKGGIGEGEVNDMASIVCGDSRFPDEAHVAVGGRWASLPHDGCSERPARRCHAEL